jgi:hypothetical protein
MKLRLLFRVLCILSLAGGTAWAQPSIKCLQNLTISVVGGEDEIVTCVGEGSVSKVKFQPNTYATPLYYLVTDAENIILKASLNPTIDFDELGIGNYRVWALSYVGLPLVEEGLDADTAKLGTTCSELSQNFIQVSHIDPDGKTVTTSRGLTDLFTCLGDGNPDILEFQTLSDDPFYTYVITDENNIILDSAPQGRYDFTNSERGICRVWGLSYVGNLNLDPGQPLTGSLLADRCFDLSDNFIQVHKVIPDGGSLMTVSGEEEATACTGDGEPDVITFLARTPSQAPYIFLRTDENNIIQEVLRSNSRDFDELPTGVCRIWGLSYSGTLNAPIGADAAAVDLSDDCFDLSDNFLQIIKKDPEGGMVSLAGGITDTRLCVNDGAPDEVTVMTNAGENENYAFAVTDEDNRILQIDKYGILDFEGSQAGICRIWGFAFTGTLSAGPGDNLDTDPLSNECWEVSANFIRITRIAPEGGTVTTSDGATETTVCLGDEGTDILNFNVEGAGTMGDFLFVLTDENNVIIDLSADGAFDFTGADPGVCRVWGLNYTGILTAQPGDDAAAIVLSDECFDLSDSFVTVTRKLVDGGAVSLVGGATEATACVQDGEPDFFEFQHATEAPESGYTLAITDENNILQVILNGGNINFDVLEPGITRVYGISFTGNLTSRINVGINSIALSDECFELSANFITINREQIAGGVLSLEGGGTEIRTCPGDGSPDEVAVFSSGGGTGAYVYLVTDTANVVFDIAQDPVYDFEGAPEGIYRIWGLAFTGALTIGNGDDADETPFSDQCAERSENFVRVLHQTPIAGTVALEDGSTEQLNCPTSSEAPVVAFDSAGVNSPSYTYLITDELNIIQALPPGDSFNFAELPNGVYRIWGLAYSGSLLAEAGNDAGSSSLSDNCYTLSSNFILIVNEEPDAGAVTTQAGDTLLFTCPGDGNADIVRFDSTGAIGEYRYLLTDTLNVIGAIVEGDSFDFETLPEGVSRVWGMAFTGNLLAVAGDDAAEAVLSDDCFDLSDNFIEVIRTVPEGGELRTDAEELSFCAGDGRPDIVAFGTSGASPAPYVLLVTDENNQLITFSDSGSVDFDPTGGGPARVWGLSYTGTLQLSTGINIMTENLSDDCFDLTDNFIPVDRTGVDGGRISSDLGDGTIYVCRGDGMEDVLTFSNTSSAGNASYQYVITNEDNRILRLLEGNEQNFEDLGLARLRVWGLSYTGNLLAGAGRDLDEDPISDGCYTTSNNFITVVLDLPEGGTVESADGETDLTLCIGQRHPVIQFEAATGSQSAYQFVLTDENNLIQQFPEADSLDFGVLDNGVYRLWGLSFTGLLLAEEGMNVDDGTLASSCFDLSDNFVTIRKGGPVDGGLVTAFGSDTYQSCPGDGIPDIVSLETTSTAAGISNYRYVITDTLDRIFIPDIEGSVLDFNGAPPGVYRIYGISYTGNFTANFGDNVTTAALSDVCYEVSSTFLTVIYLGPEGGTISTSDGLAGPLTTAACGGEVKDELSFINEGSEGENYAYLVAEADTIAAVTGEGESIDFSTLPCGFTYTVTGLTYEGTLPDLTGQPLDELLLGGLLEGCFAFSDNDIEIVQGSGLQEGSDAPRISGSKTDGAGNPLTLLHLSPNPVREQLQVRFGIDQPLKPTSELLVLSAGGRLIERLEAPTYRGENTMTVSVQELPAGVYFLYLRHGRHLRFERFVVMK